MWNRDPSFCPLCAAELVRAEIEGRSRQRCPRCDFVLYLNPACAAAGIVVDDRGRVLMIRRAIDPGKGLWALPAGYQDVDEGPAETVAREVREETGLDIEVGELFDVVFMPHNPRKPANLISYVCTVLGGELQAADDALEARFFDLDELPDDIAFENRERILEPLRSHPLVASRRAAAERIAGSPAGASTASGGLTYRDAGVDIDAQNAALASAHSAIRESFTPGVVGDIGSFGGLFDLARVDAAGELLVASADGVGTKLEVAQRAGVHDTVGRDLVNHCINDVLVQGARPHFFMDYVGTGRLDPEVIASVIRGCAGACRDGGLALLGGETAEMPGLYGEGDYDLVGFVVGSVPREQLLDGSRVRPGQVVLGLGSSGLHTNGYSLARKIVFERLGLDVHSRPPELEGATVAEALLAPHRAYHRLLLPLLAEGHLAALAHITGGGLAENFERVLTDCDAELDRDAWETPAVFRWLCAGGDVARDEAFRAFNMGIGMVLVLDADRVDVVRKRLAEQREPTHVLGRITAGRGKVRWTS